MLKRSRTRTSPGRVKQIIAKPALINGPNNRPKIGNAQQIFDKYISLARDAMTSGDRVMAESFYQHAEHYLRLINEQREFVTKVKPEETEERSAEMDALEVGDVVLSAELQTIQ